MTYIYYAYVDKENQKFLFENSILSFPADFVERILRYRRWEDFQLTLLGRLLLKFGLKKLDIHYEEENIQYSDYKKPYLKDTNVEFNISHSGKIVVCTISHINEIGIDIEKIDNIDIKDFRTQMLNSEWEKVINAKSQKDAFFEYWTQKEAVIKANGKGLSISLKSFEIINNKTKIEDDFFFLKEICLDTKYKCYVALKNSSSIQYNIQLINPINLCF